MSNQSGQTGNRCERGHNMDPAWDECPYCQAERRAGQRSATEVGSSGNDVDGRRTSMGDATAGVRVDGSGGSGRETLAMSEAGGSASASSRNFAPGSGETRQIVGVLTTYSRSLYPWGDMYPIRLGKNYIGAGRIGGSPGESYCDFLVEEDRKMSSVHALILCRPSSSSSGVRFDLIDQQSSNGTYMNDELAPLQGVTLPNYAKIKTGDTIWTFIKIVP